MINEKTQFVDSYQKILELVPKNSVIAEIGVLKGELSEQIKKICKPRRLYLVDYWQEQDDDRFLYTPYNDGYQQTHDENYYDVLKKFLNEDNVKIIKSLSLFASKLFDKDYFDMIYIDGSKYYEDTLQDFETWFPLLKHDGIICGCNYENHEDKPYIEVKEAVEYFCRKNNLYINYITYEKNSCFSITKPKIKFF